LCIIFPLFRAYSKVVDDSMRHIAQFVEQKLVIKLVKQVISIPSNSHTFDRQRKIKKHISLKNIKLIVS